MKKGFFKRFSAVILAAVMAVSLVPVMGTVTNGAVGQVEAKAAEEIRVTAETVRQFKQNVEVFKAGGMSGEALYEQVISVIDDEEIVSEINAVYEPYTTSKSQLTESLHEYTSYILQTADYYNTVLQQQQITSIIKLIKSLTKSVTLSVSSSIIASANGRTAPCIRGCGSGQSMPPLKRFNLTARNKTSPLKPRPRKACITSRGLPPILSR